VRYGPPLTCLGIRGRHSMALHSQRVVRRLEEWSFEPLPTSVRLPQDCGGTPRGHAPGARRVPSRFMSRRCHDVRGGNRHSEILGEAGSTTGEPPAKRDLAMPNARQLAKSLGNRAGGRSRTRREGAVSPPGSRARPFRKLSRREVAVSQNAVPMMDRAVGKHGSPRLVSPGSLI
jgi:hypothetical protein